MAAAAAAAITTWSIGTKILHEGKANVIFTWMGQLSAEKLMVVQSIVSIINATLVKIPMTFEFLNNDDEWKKYTTTCVYGGRSTTTGSIGGGGVDDRVVVFDVYLSCCFHIKEHIYAELMKSLHDAFYCPPPTPRPPVPPMLPLYQVFK